MSSGRFCATDHNTLSLAVEPHISEPFCPLIQCKSHQFEETIGALVQRAEEKETAFFYKYGVRLKKSFYLLNFFAFDKTYEGWNT